jgi:ribosomal protein S18 acetylase RimI-like enzyme
MSKPQWRLAAASDLAAISAIAARLHPDLPESPAVLAEKMRLYPGGCRVLVAGDRIVGYGLAHPWMQRRIPPLDSRLGQLPRDPDCIYVHDLAVLPGFRGGIARDYVATTAELACGSNMPALALVSVYATQTLWQRYGFRPVAADAELRAKLASYGDGATYMLRDLTAE